MSQKQKGMIRGGMLALCLLTAAGAANADPWLSSPTSAREGKTFEVWGGGFEPGAAIELIVLDVNDKVVSVKVTHADQAGNIHDDVAISEDPTFTLEAAKEGVDGAPLVRIPMVPGFRSVD